MLSHSCTELSRNYRGSEILGKLKINVTVHVIRLTVRVLGLAIFVFPLN